MSSDFDRQALVSIFVAEATDGMATLWTALHPANEILPSREAMQEHYIIAHRIRGAAGLYGYTALSKLGESLEALLEQATTIQPSHWPRAVELLRDLVNVCRGQVDVIAQGGQEDLRAAEEWQALCLELLAAGSAAAASSAAASLAADYLIPQLDPEVLSYFSPEAQEYVEVMETLLGRMQESPEDQDNIQKLFRTAHTLKGSANTVGFQVIGDVALPIEAALGVIRDNQSQISPTLLTLVAGAVEVIRVLLKRDATKLTDLQHDVPLLLDALQRFQRGESVECPVLTLASTGSASAQRASVGFARSQEPASVGEVEPTVADDYLVPNLDAEVLSYFGPEAQEYVETLEANLLRLEKEPENKDTIHQLFRTAHTLKGSAYTVGFQSIGDLVHHIEDFMGAVRDGRTRVMPGMADLVLKAVDLVRTLMRRDPNQVGKTRSRFMAVMRDLKKLEQGMSLEAATPVAGETLVPEWTTLQSKDSHLEGDPAKTDEARGVEEREVIRVSRDRLERLLNLVGELVIGRGRLEQRLVMLEQLSSQVQACKNRLLDAVRSFEDKHTFTFPTISKQDGEPTGPSFSGLSDFGALEFDKYDDFNILARRISEVTADIGESMSQLSGSIRHAHEDMGQLQQLTLGMRDEIARARMVPIGTPFTRFRRAVREMVRTTGKEVTLVTSGEHTEVDTNLVERLVDPLIHLVRNAVYHGIEPTAARVANGKPPAGTVYLHAAHRGNSVMVEVEDDGAGLDLERVRTKAIALGLVRAEAVAGLSDADIIKFIFMPGFSTADQIGDQAGRGVGLDVVKRVIESMSGHIEVESVRGVGTKFTLQLPLTLLIATALMVRAGRERYAIPLQAVREVTLPSAGSVQQIGDRTLLQLGDEAIEVRPLLQLLKWDNSKYEGATPIVIVRTAAGPLGLAVDELLGRQEIVIKPLGGLRPLKRSYFGGATIDPEGRVILVIDVGRLTASPTQEPSALGESSVPLLSADEMVPTEAGPEVKPAERAILLIDDSLSIRKFVGRMLESAGYQVDTAVDGEDGLRKASAQAYRLIITDLEMPKLNGFEVIQALRGRPQTASTPIMVMTTRAGEKHRQMAINVGATAYIAKPVEERALIREVEQWLSKETGVRK
jgi:chemosensory pili system protein ChpA (sensor histidine kinase/response regulator)